MPATASAQKLPFGLESAQVEAVENVARRALVQTLHMIWEANERDDAEQTDPKVGGHPSACASSLQATAALHLVARRPQDFWCAKPHLAPLDHALHHLLGFFRDADGGWMEEDAAKAVMSRLRKFSREGEPVFQSYHADTDPDSWRILPSGTVGIPPVASGYLALCWEYLVDHGMVEDQDVHFWSLLGDSEFREGSLAEAITDFSERGLSNVTWIVDYNRQSLDGTRIPHNARYAGTDAHRIQATLEANGWLVIQAEHGRKRRELFARDGGEALEKAFTGAFTDFEMQALMWKRDAGLLREHLHERAPDTDDFVGGLGDEELLEAFADLGGHDVVVMLEAYEKALASDRPTTIVAHTVKGWGTDAWAMPGNHSTLPDEDEVQRRLKEQSLSMDDPYAIGAGWRKNGPERTLLRARGEELRAGVAEQEKRRDAARRRFDERLEPSLPLPEDAGIDLSMLPVVHSQWMIGQVAGRLVRIATDDEYREAGIDPGRELSDEEKRWAAAADMVLTISPDVGTSTNINPTMDGKIYGAVEEENYEEELEWKERGRPQLYSTNQPWTRHVRFEIAEAAAMSCAGAFGKADQYFGVPLMPVMTVYDFFIKRALDQFYYDAYWRSGMIVVGTPSGTTLSPEGAQHSWKSDIQMPNMLTWEPLYAREMEWVLCDALRRRVTGDDEDRSVVVVRGVTMGVRQKEMLKRLKAQERHAGRGDEEILAAVREDVLAGGWWLVHHEGEDDYQPGDNVVNLLAMGPMGTEALKASDRLRELGIYANVLMVSCADLLLGRFAERDGYAQLRKLGVDGDVHLVGTAGETLDRADAVLLAARTVPVVSVVDGEPGLLDNAGSVLGVKQVSLGVTKFSKSARPAEIYAYHGMDAEAIVKAAGRALSESTLREVRLSRQAAEAVAENAAAPVSDWRELWPYDGDED